LTNLNNNLVDRYTQFTSDFPLLLDALLSCPEIVIGDHATIPRNAGGVYAISDNSTVFYVGQANNIEGRMRAHISSDIGKASLARCLLKAWARQGTVPISFPNFVESDQKLFR
jgi:hypothetical protein